MKVDKWNYATREYDVVEIPDDRKVGLYSQDMNEIINCVSCGKEMRFGNSYTSLEYHTKMGFGYCVCDKCYELEHKRRLKFEYGGK